MSCLGTAGRVCLEALPDVLDAGELSHVGFELYPYDRQRSLNF